MNHFRGFVGTACVLTSLTLTSSAYAISYFEDFESGILGSWQSASTGGISSFGVQLHNGSQMAFVSHVGWGPRNTSSTTQTSLSRDFVFSANDILSFDMQAIATAFSDHGITRHSGGGVKITLLNAFNIPVGSAGLYNYTNPALLGANSYLIDGLQHNYSASMADFANLAGLGAGVAIAKISLGFDAWGQFTSGGNVQLDVAGSANVWFDNVSAVPEPGSLMLLLPGLALTIATVRLKLFRKIAI